MAETKDVTAAQTPPEFSEATIAKARQWFKKGRDCGGRREYDYGIECFITGLGFWPEAVEDGHKPLRAIAIARAQAGGKKPGMMEALKKPMGGKDAKQGMLNAEFLMSKDPTSASYVDGLLKNANKAELNQTTKWVAPLVLDSMRKDKKPNAGRFRAFRQTLQEAAERADAQSDSNLATWLFEQAVRSLDYLVARNPTDMALKTEQRNLSGRLTISRGKYGEADTFRDSLQDADKQKILHDTVRIKQADETVDALIAAARKELEAHPNVASKINALTDTLLRRERPSEESESIELLLKYHTELNNYSFKSRADDIRLKQLKRQTRRLRDAAMEDPTDENKQQSRLADMEHTQTELAVMRERCSKYPTDLRLKFRLGGVLFKLQQYDEAIPVLQTAQADPKTKTRCQLLIGRSFFERGSHSQAREVLKETLEEYELSGDEIHKLLLYWLGRAYEADGSTEEAAATLGKLVRLDYNYAGGDARKRLDALKK
ncbi:MAG: tetratricopeptide repeat protein [Planctomycetes bacterium]|nr:tetratricopeptide repeat protein [Planctomycetota bacterium]